MKQAILIMMHKNPAQLERLVRYFPEDRCVCFIHVDKKANIKPEELQERLNLRFHHCIVIMTSMSGALTCWSLVQISLELLKGAQKYEQEHAIHFTYYRLLSGQDYPIKSFLTYEDFLQKHYPQDFLGVEKPEESKHLRDKFSRWRFSNIRQYIIDASVSPMLKKIMVIAAHVWEIIWTKLIGTPEKKLLKKGFLLSAGPSWWTLTDRFVAYLLEENSSTQQMIKVIKNTATPEESFIQMVYVNSPFYEGQSTYNMTVGNYGRREQAVDGHTHPWRTPDYQELIESDCFFARKFDTEIDEKILDLLDAHIYR